MNKAASVIDYGLLSYILMSNIVNVSHLKIWCQLQKFVKIEDILAW